MKKKMLVTVLAVALFCTSLGGVALARDNAPTTAISTTEATKVTLTDAYFETGSGGGTESITIASDAAGSFFDAVRINDWFSLKVNVPQAGKYYVCLGIAWVAGGQSFEISVDGGAAVTLSNSKAGTDFRTWYDTDGVLLDLPQGEHTLKVTSKTAAGPVIHSLTVYPPSMLSTEYKYYDDRHGGDASYDAPTSANNAEETIGIHFASNYAVKSLKFSCCTWSNNPGGGLKFTVYKWNSTYTETLKGEAVATYTKEAINDGETIEVPFATPLPAGNYLVFVQNTGTSDKSIGFWASKTDEAETYEYASLYYKGDPTDRVTIRMTAVYNSAVPAPYADLGELVDSLAYYGAGRTPIQITGDLGIQFVAPAPVDKISILEAPSWGNDIGSLRFIVYKWDGSYAKSLKGPELAKKDFVNFADNSRLDLTLDTPLPAGEYVVVLRNISDPIGEMVGVYAADSAFPYAVNYKDGQVIPNAAHMVVHFTESVFPNAYEAVSIPNPGSGDTNALVPFAAMILVVGAALLVRRRKKGFVK